MNIYCIIWLHEGSRDPNSGPQTFEASLLPSKLFLQPLAWPIGSALLFPELTQQVRPWPLPPPPHPQCLLSSFTVWSLQPHQTSRLSRMEGNRLRRDFQP